MPRILQSVQACAKHSQAAKKEVPKGKKYLDLKLVICECTCAICLEHSKQCSCSAMPTHLFTTAKQPEHPCHRSRGTSSTAQHSKAVSVANTQAKGVPMRPKTQVDAPTVMVSPNTKAAEEPARPANRYTDRKVQWPRTASTSGATVYRAYVFSAKWLKLSCRNADDTSLHARTRPTVTFLVHRQR